MNKIISKFRNTVQCWSDTPVTVQTYQYITFLILLAFYFNLCYNKNRWCILLILWGNFTIMMSPEIKEALSKGSAYINRCLVKEKTSFHSHNFVEIAYVAEGSGIHTIEDHSYRVEKGHITLINYDIPHEFDPTEQEMVIYNCIFTPSYFDAVLTGSRNFFDVTNHFLLGNFYHDDFEKFIDVHAGSSDNGHIRNLFDRMLKEYTRKQIGYKEIMRGYLIELLIIMFRLQLQTETEANPRLMDVLDYINIHYTEDIKVETLAAIAHSSTSHFCRTFKALTHSTVTNYLQALRMEEACRLLKETDKNVIEIAQEVGYSDSKHFYNVFKKITGKRPKDFR